MSKADEKGEKKSLKKQKKESDEEELGLKDV